MCHELLADAKFFELLLRYDEDLAAAARKKGCRCGGRLDSARFPRKPRGGPADLEGYDKRFSFCCAKDGCRSRVTPPSVRFLARRVYLGAVVVLVSAMRYGLSSRRLQKLYEHIGADRRTLERWRRWWLQAFVRSELWREAKGRFMPPVDENTLPASLLERFAGGLLDRVVWVLHLLGPMTSGSCKSMFDLNPQRLLMEKGKTER